MSDATGAHEDDVTNNTSLKPNSSLRPKPFAPQNVRTTTQLQHDLKAMFPFLTRTEVSHASHLGAPFYLAPPLPSLNQFDTMDPRKDTLIPHNAIRDVERMHDAVVSPRRRQIVPPSVVATGVSTYSKLLVPQGSDHHHHHHQSDHSTALKSSSKGMIAQKLTSQPHKQYPLPMSKPLLPLPMHGAKQGGDDSDESQDERHKQHASSDSSDSDGDDDNGGRRSRHRHSKSSSSSSSKSPDNTTILNAKDILRLRARLPPGYRIVRSALPSLGFDESRSSLIHGLGGGDRMMMSNDGRSASSSNDKKSADQTLATKPNGQKASDVTLHMSRILDLLSKRHKQVVKPGGGEDNQAEKEEEGEKNDLGGSRSTFIDGDDITPDSRPVTGSRQNMSSSASQRRSSISNGIGGVSPQKAASLIQLTAPSTIPSNASHSTTRVRIEKEQENVTGKTSGQTTADQPGTNNSTSMLMGIFDTPRHAGVGMSQGSSIAGVGSSLKEDSYNSPHHTRNQSSSSLSASRGLKDVRQTQTNQSGKPMPISKPNSRSHNRMSSTSSSSAIATTASGSISEGSSLSSTGGMNAALNAVDNLTSLPALGHQSIGALNTTPLRCGLLVHGNVWAAERSGSIVIRSVATGQLVGNLNTGDLVAALCYVPGTPLVDTASTQAASSSNGGASALAAVSQASAEEAALQQQQAAASQVQTGFGTIGGYPFPTVWVGTKKGVILIYKATTRRLIKQVHIHVGCVTAIVRTPVCVISSSLDFQINVWSLSGKYLRSLVGHTNGVRCLLPVGHGVPLSDFQRAQSTFTRDDSNSATSQADGQNQAADGSLLDLNGNHFETLKLEAIAEAASSMVYLYSGSDDGTLKLWDVKTGECLQSVSIGRGSVLSIITTGRTIWTATETGLITSWTLGASLVPIKSADTPGLRIQHLLAMGPHVWSCGQDPRIYVWDAETMQFVTTLNGHTKFCNHLVKVDTVTVRTIWSLSMGDGTARVWRSITNDSSGLGDNAESLAALSSEYLTVRSHLKAVLDGATGAGSGSNANTNLSQLQNAFQSEIDKVVYDLAITQIGNEDLTEKLEVSERRVAELEAQNRELSENLARNDSERVSAQAHIRLLLDKIALVERQREKEHATYQNRLEPLERRLVEQTHAVDKNVRALAAEFAKSRESKKIAEAAQNTLLTAETRLALFADAAAWERNARQRTQKESINQRDTLISLQSEVARLQGEIKDLTLELQKQRDNSNDLSKTIVQLKDESSLKSKHFEDASASADKAYEDLKQKMRTDLDDSRRLCESLASHIQKTESRMVELEANLNQQKELNARLQKELSSNVCRADELQRNCISIEQRIEVARQVARGLILPSKLNQVSSVTESANAHMRSPRQPASELEGQPLTATGSIVLHDKGLYQTSTSKYALQDPLSPSAIMNAVAEELKRCKDSIRAVLGSHLSASDRLQAGIPLHVSSKSVTSSDSEASSEQTSISDRFGFKMGNT